MAKIRYTSIRPGFVFEHEGVKLKAVENPNKKGRCFGCALLYYGSCVPCVEGEFLTNQKHDLIFKKVEDENNT